MNRINHISKVFTVSLVFLIAVLCGCSNKTDKETSLLAYRFATKEEGRDLLAGNEEYYQGLSDNELEYKMQKKGAGKEEFLAFAKQQIEDFTDEEEALLAGYFESMRNTLEEKGYDLPPLEEIVLIKSTMKDEADAYAYTHGTQIYLNGEKIEKAATGDEELKAETELIMWHELFHCLTRCNPDFRKDMYKFVHFTVTGQDYRLPPSVLEYHISNPDVEHHDSYATFVIDGKEVDCFTDLVTTRHFEKEGDDFFDYMNTALIPVDGTDRYYTPEQAANFDEVFGRNTDYVVDPEECMADNFSFAMYYGIEGIDGKGYPDPQIIEGIISYLKTE